MSAVDFGDWAIPDLELTLGGRTYMVSPPSVDDGKVILAAAARGEVNLGIVKGDLPDEVARVLERVKPGEHPALGAAVHAQMVADGLPQATIDRVTYYAVFYWARGREYADHLASLLWAPRQTEEAGAEANPKG